MTEENGSNNQRRQGSGSLLTAASALTSLGSGSDQLPEEGADQASPQVQQNDSGDDDDDDGPPSRKGRSGQSEDDVPMTFPQRLMELLDNQQHSDVVAWLPHGKGFIIYQKKRFAGEILPRYFKQAKFTSFTRKLNRWGFQRVSRGAETGAYFHQYFQRGNPRLCMQMCCQSARGTVLSQALPRGGGVGFMNPLPSAMTGVLLPPMPQPAQVPSGLNSTMAEMCLQSPNPMMNQVQPNVFNSAAQISPSPRGMGNPGMGMGMGMGMNMFPGAQGMPLQMQGHPPQADSSDSELNPSQSLMRLQELQKQQEQLLMQQKQIKEQMAAVAKTLPQLSPASSPALPPPPLTEPQQQQSQSQSQDMMSPQHQSMGQQQQQQHQNINPMPLHSSETPVNQPQQGGNGNNVQTSSMYSQNVVNAAIDALQRSNTPGYLQMLMAAQGNGPKTAEEASSNSSQAFQNQLHASVRAQHDQLQQYRAAQQKMALSGHHQHQQGGAGGMGGNFSGQDNAGAPGHQMHAMASFGLSGGMSQQQRDSTERKRSSSAKRASAA